MNNKTKTIQVRVTEDEYNSIYNMYTKSKCNSISEYARYKVLTKDNNQKIRQVVNECYPMLVQVIDELNYDPSDKNNVIEQIQNLERIGNKLCKDIIISNW